jgi:hypothetical protein
MSWNYRVTRVKGETDDYAYGIREVYYAEDGAIQGWTAKEVPLYGDSWSELVHAHALMGGAFDRPVIDVTDEKNPVEVDPTEGRT